MTLVLPDVMLDIETLGNGRNGMIVQIGAVRFNAHEGEKGVISSPEGSFKFNVEPTGEDLVDGFMEFGTVKWWLGQSREAQQRVFYPVEGTHGNVLEGAVAFVNWLTSQGDVDHLWANPPEFDLRLVREAYSRAQQRAIRGAWPLSYRAPRCYRTLKTIGRLLGVEEPVRVGVHHDALDDAFHQAGHAINVLRACKEAGLSRQKVAPEGGGDHTQA